MTKLQQVVVYTAAVGMVAITSASAQEPCVGDCNADAQVTVDEVVAGVNLALGLAEVSSCPAFDGNEDGQVTVDEILTAVNNALEGCPTNGGEGLGVRRFSLSAQSRFELIGLPLPLSSNQFTGYLELEAGPEDESGLRSIDVVGASEYLTAVLTPPIGSPVIVCIKPPLDEFPFRDAGFLACNGTDLGGLELVQDHNISDVDPTCSMGMPDVNPLHPGTCNSDVEAILLSGESGPGAAAIAPDPNTLEGGLPVTILVEEALPCGDEGVEGIETPFAVNTVVGRATIRDAGNFPGRILSAERAGVNFDCANWTQEDGPGTFVLLAPLLDLDTGVLGFVDAIGAFILAD